MLYLVTGFVSDVTTKFLERRRERVLQVIGVVLFEHDRDAEAVHEDVADLPRRMLLRVLQNLAVDLDGVAQQRVRQLVRTTGLERFIRRRSRSPLAAAGASGTAPPPRFRSRLRPRRLLEDRHPGAGPSGRSADTRAGRRSSRLADADARRR
ncbi:MAG: hypothetical protein R2710_18210 [Acidimicrobiales bacterium]